MGKNYRSCSAELSPDAAFCGQCGRKVKGGTERRRPLTPSNGDHKRRESTEELKKRSMAELAELRQIIAAAAASQNKVAVPLVWLFVAAAVFGGFLQGKFISPATFIPLIMAVVAAKFQGWPNRWLHAREYYKPCWVAHV